jgi:hypothetical protein
MTTDYSVAIFLVKVLMIYRVQKKPETPALLRQQKTPIQQCV